MSSDHEIAILGGDSGRGEAIVIYNSEDIVIVDCFMDSRTRQPAPLAYLNSLGADLKKVKLIVATHFHDDHIRGLDEVVHACPSAEVAFSDALNSDEFRTLVIGESFKPITNPSMKTFHNVLKYLSSRDIAPIFASQDKQLATTLIKSFEVWALSPASQTILDSRSEIIRLIDDYKDLSTSIPSNSGNHFSTVLLLRMNGSNILLGADLEVSNHPRKGWQAVAYLSSLSKISNITLFKIPHHGSHNGYCKGVWNKINRSSRLGVTAYSSSALPRPEMIDVFKNHSENLYLTFCQNKFTARRASIASVDKIIERTKGIKFTRGNRTYNAIVFNLPNGTTRLINNANHVNDC